MRTSVVSILFVISVLFGGWCCGSEKVKDNQAGTKGDLALPGEIEGTVMEALPAGRYLYVELNTGTGSVWVAAVADSIPKGTKVRCAPQMLMEDFYSQILKRTFPRLYFASLLTEPPKHSSMPTNHPSLQEVHAGLAERGMPEAAEIKVDVPKAEGGKTIAEISAEREKLKGAEILLRGKVTKYNSDILGANWLRVRDASDKRDLAVTTKAEAKVGDTVLIRGNLECNVNLGSGYSYDLIIRNAEVTVEKTVKP